MAEKNRSERFLVWNKELDKLEDKEVSQIQSIIMGELKVEPENLHIKSL